ncbi:MAG: DUF2231 domain-containing protein [bacterium]|nr:DUF2231 domain-containing protein [bacterium]
MNIHPLIVHFPIALLILGAICDAIGILMRRDFFLKTGHLLLAMGATAAIAAAITGENAAEVAEKIPGITEDLERHETLSTAVAWLSVALTLTRSHFVFKKRFTGTTRILYLVIAIAIAALTAASGYTGGRMVYEYGAGTVPVLNTIQNTP